MALLNIVELFTEHMEALHDALEKESLWDERTKAFLAAFERFYKIYKLWKTCG